jgi:hypothetical protein
MSSLVLRTQDFSGVVRIANLPNATSPQEPVTLAQLNSAIEGLAWKDNARVATPANLNLAAPGAAIDGVTLALNDRVLVRAQTAAAQNGIYVFNGAAAPMTRAPDANAAVELHEAIVTVDEGTSAGATFRQTAVNFTLDTDPVLWVAFGTGAPPASETTPGIVALATQAEVNAGTAANKAVTPATLAASNLPTRRYAASFGDGAATSYAQIAVEVVKLGIAYMELRKQQQLQAELQKDSAEKDAQIEERLRKISQATGITVTSIKELNAAQAAGTLVFDAAAAVWMSAAQAQQRLGKSSDEVAASLARIETDKLSKQFAGWAAGGKDAEEALKKTTEALTKLAAAAKLDNAAGVSGFTRALEDLRSSGTISAAQVGDAWESALKRLDASQIDKLAAAMKQAVQDGTIGAAQYKQIFSAMLQDVGVNTALALDQVSAGARKAMAEVDLVAASVAQAGVKSAAAARDIEMAFAAAIGKADSLAAIAALQDKLKALYEAGKIGADELMRIGDALTTQKAKIEEQLPGIQSVAEAYKNLGVNAAVAMDRISPAARAAIDSLILVTQAASASARGIEMAFVAAVPKADSLKAIDALDAQLKTLADSGKIGADGIARIKAALDKQKQAVEEQLPGIQRLEEALRKLGVTPQKELDNLARDAKEAFAAVLASGTATPREIDAAWKAMAEAAIRANGGVADATIQSQAAMHGFTIVTDEAGQSVIKSMREAGDSVRDAGNRFLGFGDNAEKAGSKGEEAGRKIAGSWGGVKNAIDGASGALGNYDKKNNAVNTSAPTWSQNTDGRTVSATEPWDVVEARIKNMIVNAFGVQALGNSAAEEWARMAYALSLREQDLNRTPQSLALNSDVTRALRDQLSNAVVSLRSAVAAQADAVRAQLGDTSGRQPGTGSTDGEPVIGGGRNVVNLSITLNVYGITDPVELARKVEPELKKLARLAR